MSRIRLVTPGDGDTPMTFAEAARAALERALARDPVALTIVFETGGDYDEETVPNSRATCLGLIAEFARATDGVDIIP